MRRTVWNAPARTAPWLLAGFALGGCAVGPTVVDTPAAALSAVEPALDRSSGPLSGSAMQVLGPGYGATHLLASERYGLLLLSEDGAALSRAEGAFESAQARRWGAPGTEQPVFASADDQSGDVVIFRGNGAGTGLEPRLRVPTQGAELEGLCLHVDHQDQLQLFTLHGAGEARQWLLGTAQGWRSEPTMIRRLAIPPGAEDCSVDDERGLLYVIEPDVGAWAYDADPESPIQRTPVDLLQPFGSLARSITGIAAIPGGVVIADAEAHELRVYRHGEGGYLRDSVIRLPADVVPERVSALSDTAAGLLRFGVYDDARDGYAVGQVAWTPPTQSFARIPVVMPSVETAPVAEVGDAADDPAVWIHPEDPSLSLVLGTNKQAGLEVYSLTGERLQNLAVGPVNNVDLRYRVGAAGLDLAVATKRDDHSLAFFAIDGERRRLRYLGNQVTDMPDIYGLCMYQAPSGDTHVFANDKDGRVQQYRLALVGESVTATHLRSIVLPSQPEGCVADDARGVLYMGEEDGGIWIVGADPQDDPAPTRIKTVGGELVADIEGLALHHAEDATLLVVSSQGNDSYVVYDAQPPYRLRGRFRIGLNAQAGIDGASETDGLEVVSTPLPPHFPAGLLVVQDGRNLMPDAPQNFKLVPWERIDAVLTD